MVKLVYFFVAVLMIFIQGTCCFIMRKRETQSKAALFKLNMASIFTSLFYVFSILNLNYTISVFINGLYFSSIHWLLLFFLDYIFVLTDGLLVYKSAVVFRKVWRILAIIDTVCLFVNNFYDWAFVLVPYFQNEVFYCWELKTYLYFNIHLALCYFLVLVIFLILVKEFLTSNKFYRTKYFILLVAFCGVVTINAFYLFSNQKIDISTLTYSFFGIASSYFTFFTIPRDIEAKMLSLVSENIEHGVLCFDVNKRCIYANKAAKQFFPNEGDAEAELKKLLAENKDQLKREVEIDKDDVKYVVSEEFHVIKGSTTKALGYSIVVEDITKELRKLNDEIYRSTHDLLTGLLNRTNFFIEVEKIIKESPDVPRYIVCTDIDNFKIVNDLFGTNLGDIILKKQAGMLLMAKKDDTVFGRISGDKFAMLIRKTDFNAEKALENTQKICSMLGKFNYKLVFRVGIYEISDPFESVSSMCDKALMAINKSLDIPETTISYYSASLMNDLIEEKKVVSVFFDALEKEQFQMYLQPLVRSSDEKVAGAEALVRWIHPERGIIYPSSFVSILENTGNLHHLDYYIWDKAAQKLAEWKKRNIDLRIAVNVSAKDFYHLNLYEVFTGLVKKYDISPQNLNIEITETVLMHDLKMHTNVLRQLQNFGFSIEMDDFGSGYSSLNMLNNITVDILKIDMVFLKKTENVERSKKILNSIIKMAKQLEMKIITEGVEDEENAEFLRKTGCDYFQGYLYSKPVSEKEFEERFLNSFEKSGEKE